jgi:hypothetical protein
VAQPAPGHQQEIVALPLEPAIIFFISERLSDEFAFAKFNFVVFILIGFKIFTYSIKGFRLPLFLARKSL